MLFDAYALKANVVLFILKVDLKFLLKIAHNPLSSQTMYLYSICIATVTTFPKQSNKQSLSTVNR